MCRAQSHPFLGASILYDISVKKATKAQLHTTKILQYRYSENVLKSSETILCVNLKHVQLKPHKMEQYREYMTLYFMILKTYVLQVTAVPLVSLLLRCCVPI